MVESSFLHSSPENIATNPAIQSSHNHGWPPAWGAVPEDADGLGDSPKQTPGAALARTVDWDRKATQWTSVADKDTGSETSQHEQSPSHMT